ncbi:rhomboid family intramembrane serine protease [soil metagenome]
MNGFLDEFKNAFSKPGNGLVKIIIINLIVFLALLVLEVFLTLSGANGIYAFILQQLMLPSSIENFLVKPWTLFTYFFTHEGFFHFAFNMLWLYWFGKLTMEYLGSQKLVNIYVLGGIVGGITFIIIYNILPFFSDQVTFARMLGASAGVYAVVVAAATLMPNYTFFLFLIGPIKIKYIALFYVIVSFAQTTGQNAGGNLAHLGGALIGFLFIQQMHKGVDLGKPVTKTMAFISGFFTKKPKIKVSYSSPKRKPTSTTTVINRKANQDEIDLILDKISESGYESLTKEEKQLLFNASKK